MIKDKNVKNIVALCTEFYSDISGEELKKLDAYDHHYFFFYHNSIFNICRVYMYIKNYEKKNG